MKDLLDELRTPQFSDALLRPLLAYLLVAREATGGDLELNIILLVIAIRTVEHPEFRRLSMMDRLGEAQVFPSLGVNTHSISESSGIPRETVRRKVAELVQRGWIAQVGKNLHFASKAYVELAAIREARERLALDYYELVRGETLNLKDLSDELLLRNPHFGDGLLKPLLAYLLAAREGTGGDLELKIIMMVIATRTVDHPEFHSLSMMDRLGEAQVFPSLGVNSHSISDSSGIPPETVRRKVAQLLRKGWIVRVGRNLHVTSKAYTELTAIREARERLAVDYYEHIRSEILKLRSDYS
jgi:DNA-binding Lrp family transcriptional regulator